jgi:hypothetical protein
MLEETLFRLDQFLEMLKKENPKQIQLVIHPNQQCQYSCWLKFTSVKGIYATKFAVVTSLRVPNNSMDFAHFENLDAYHACTYSNRQGLERMNVVTAEWVRSMVKSAIEISRHYRIESPVSLS